LIQSEVVRGLAALSIRNGLLLNRLLARID
jgi:hypothetical protein